MSHFVPGQFYDNSNKINRSGLVAKQQELKHRPEASSMRNPFGSRTLCIFDMLSGMFEGSHSIPCCGFGAFGNLVVIDYEVHVRWLLTRGVSPNQGRG